MELTSDRVERQETVQRQRLQTGYEDVVEAARLGTRGASGALPHLETIQRSFGKHDVSSVEAHTDEAAAAGSRAMGAAAFTMGNHVAFAGEPSLRTAAHEAAHTIQQRQGVQLQGDVGRGGDRHEQHADAVAARVVAGRSSEDLLDTSAGCTPSGFDGAAACAPSVSRAGVQMQPQPRPATKYDGFSPDPRFVPTPEEIFEDMVAKPVIIPSGADLALESYKKIDVAKRRALFDKHYPLGNIERLLKAVSATNSSTLYMDQMRELLRWVQEAATRALSGQTDEQMADKQKKFMVDKAIAAAKAAAAAAAPPGAPLPTPTPEQLAKAHADNIAQNSIPPTPPTVKKYPTDYSAAEVSQWEADGQKVITDMVDYAKINYPALKLTAANLKIDYAGVLGRGATVLAYHEDGPPPRAVGGFAFVTAAKVNPKYMIEVVVHEGFGHSEIEGLTSSYGLSIYDKAAAKMSGMRPSRQIEYDSFGYHESEIYSILRAFQYHQDVDPADAGKSFLKLAKPKDEVDRYVQKIIVEWEGTLAVALLRGLYERLRLDVRIVAPALEAFREVIRARFSAADSANILK